MPRTSLFLVALLLVCGCQRTEFSVTMNVEDGKLKRILHIKTEPTVEDPESKSRDRTNLSPSQIEAFCESYNAKSRFNENGCLEIQGVFNSELPGENGGHGRFQRYASPLGDGFVYTERWAGELNQSKLWDEQKKAIGLVLLATSEFVSQHIEDDQWGEAASRFINGPLRQDLESIILKLGVASTHVYPESDRRAPLPSPMAMTLQMAIERDYVRLQDVPKLFMMMQTEDTAAGARFAWQTLMRLVRTPQLSAPTPSIPEDWLTEKGFEQSVKKFIGAHPRWANHFGDDKNRVVGSGSTAESGNPSSIGFDSIAHLFVIFPDADWIVQLYCPTEPLATNGYWDASTQSIRWRFSYLEKNPSLMLASATWVDPNTQRQTELFGSTVIHESQLLFYAVWFNGLSSEQQTRWNTLLDETQWDDVASVRNFEKAFETSGEVDKRFKEPIRILVNRTESLRE